MKREPAIFMRNLADTAELLGVSERQVQRLSRLGMPKAGRNLYDWRLAVPWVFEHMRERRDEAPTRQTERIALLRAQRDLCELQVAEERSKLLPAALVHEVIDALQGFVGAGLDSLLAPELSERFAALDDPHDLQSVLFEHCREARRQIARSAGQYAEELLVKAGEG